MTSGLASVVGTVRRSRGVGLVFADQALISGTNFLTGILVARALGITEFGVFSLAWMVVLVAQSIQVALIISPMMSVGPKQPPAEAPAWYAATFLQQLALAGVLSVAMAAVWLADALLAFGWNWIALAGPLALCVPVIQVQDFLRRYNFVLKRPGIVFASDCVRNGGQLVLLVVLLQAGPPNADVSLVLLAIAICALGGIGVFAVSMPPLCWGRAQFGRVARHHARLSGWLLGSSLLQWLSGQLFIIVGGAMLGAAAVGAMKAAQNLVAVTHVFFQAADNIVPPRAARIFHRDGQAGLDRFVRILLLAGGAVTALVCLTLAVPAQWWLRLLFGPEYADYGWLVAAFAVSYLLWALSMPLRYAFVTIENTRPIFSGYVLTSLFTVVGCYPMIDWLGLQGAMAGIIATQAIMLARLTVAYRCRGDSRPSMRAPV